MRIKVLYSYILRILPVTANDQRIAQTQPELAKDMFQTIIVNSSPQEGEDLGEFFQRLVNDSHLPGAAISGIELIMIPEQNQNEPVMQDSSE